MALRNQDWNSPDVIREASELTDSYVAGTVLTDLHLFNHMVLYIDITLGSLTTSELIIEFSSDNINFYQETAQTVTGGVILENLAEHRLQADGQYRIAFPIKDRYMRVSAKGTGIVTGSSMQIQGMKGII